MAQYDLVGVTDCATEVAYTFMAEETLEKAAQKLGYKAKVETYGQTGAEHELTSEEIKTTEGVVIASNVDVDPDRFAGERVVIAPVAKGTKKPKILIGGTLNSETPIYKPEQTTKSSVGESSAGAEKLGTKIYTPLVNGVSHILPFVMAGGVLTTVSFFWDVYSADPKNSQYNQFAYMLDTIGSTAMGLMVPVLGAFIVEVLVKKLGLVVDFAARITTSVGSGDFLGAIIGGYLAAIVVLLLQKLMKPLPDKEFRGLKSIFLLPVLGISIAGAIMFWLSGPIKATNTGVISWLKGLESSDLILLDIIVDVMCASDSDRPINEVAYVTGTVLLTQGNYYFMVGVSAACIAPPLATGFAILLNREIYSKNEHTAGYINFLLGLTYVTEGAISFAARHPSRNTPTFMVGSTITVVLTYVSGIQVPAPYGGFVILLLVNKPFLWILWIVVGALISGVLLALIAGRFARTGPQLGGGPDIDVFGEEENVNKSVAEKKTTDYDLKDTLDTQNTKVNVDVPDKDSTLEYLASFAVKNGLANDGEGVCDKYLAGGKESSTGITDGLVIPYAQSAVIG